MRIRVSVLDVLIWDQTHGLERAQQRSHSVSVNWAIRKLLSLWYGMTSQRGGRAIPCLMKTWTNKLTQSLLRKEQRVHVLHQEVQSSRCQNTSVNSCGTKQHPPGAYLACSAWPLYPAAGQSSASPCHL